MISIPGLIFILCLAILMLAIESQTTFKNQ